MRTMKHIRKLIMLLALLAPMAVWGQTDYSGVYYIGTAGYNAGTPADNYYLCPTEGWIYYKPTNQWSTDGNAYPNPFLTTYKCKTNAYNSGNSSTAVWYVEKHPNQNYYYIRHASDGKYLVSNGQISGTTNANRMRVHLEELSGDPDDKALFSIYSYSTYLVISPKSSDGWNGNYKWYTVNNGNKDYLVGNGSNGGPTGYTATGGIIGLYTENDANAKFYLEPALSIDPPTITNNFDGTITITTETGATIYYTTDETTPTITDYTGTGTTSVSFALADGVTVIKAIAKSSSDYFATYVRTYTIPQCEKPIISVSGSTATITCSTPNASIFYALDDLPATPSTPYGDPFNTGGAEVIRAIATKLGYLQSAVAYYYPSVVVHSSSEMTNMNGRYILADDFTSSASIGTADNPFKGFIDGNYNAFTLSGHALIGVAEDAVIKNIVVSSVTYSGSGNVGAIINTAKGTTKLYNSGVQGGSVSGGTNAGGLVGLIESGSSVRVVNCYNYATVSGGTTMAGIVGKNEGTVGDVRIALCMMYGDMPGGTSPVYAGNHVSNASNFTEYNYYRSRANLTYTAYNDQLAIDKDEYLTRFPFYRHILNSHRELASYFLFGDYAADHVNEIGHWEIDKSNANCPYPIVEEWEKNTKKVLDAPAGTTVSVRKGDGDPITSLAVTVKIGSNTYNRSLPITDMDETNYDYTWGKVVLPFANEFEVNTDYDYICTGWKITGITGGTAATFSDYNVSDRDCTAKDLYSTTGFIFAQGGNYVVPYNVTAIEITANFATAYYLSDESYDIGYSGDKSGSNVSGYDGRTPLGGSTPATYHGKTVYNTLAAALAAMAASGTTHSQAVVLVGNYHQDDEDLKNLTSKGLTIMSIDADNNQEPDYAWYSNNTQDRPAIPPTRFDFVAVIPVGMSSRVNNSTFYPGIPIWKPRGWFEMTETSLSKMDQFELNSNNFNTSDNDTRNYRCIINGGYFTQMVRSRKAACNKVKYYQIGGNAYIKEFYPGSHSADNYGTVLCPINVTGGEIEQCFMTGFGKGTAIGPNIYFWCAGGKIDKFLGAYMEKPRQTSSADGNVNLTAKIDHARIGRFFGGGTSPKAPITGNIDITINNSHVYFYCGGPEFGDMVTGKTVTTRATNTIFDEYYGAGFGGTAITYTNDEDNNNQGLGSPTNPTVTYPGSFFSNHYVSQRLQKKDGYGLGSCYKFEFIFNSRGAGSVARFYTGYAQFDLATTGSVTNELTGCTFNGDFYGAGCQGRVSGTVTSTLTNCSVNGSAYGGGYKAVSNEVEIYTATAPSMSVYTRETGIFSDFGEGTHETYEWIQGDASHDGVAGTGAQAGKLYTSKDITMTDLGNVTGAITLTLNGSTTVNENVFGGGNMSKSLDNTTVNLRQGVQVFGNVYGGGNKGTVGGSSRVLIQDQEIQNN